ncbi:hypothetical protein J1614_002445 [Plenodomus biglobosus]|nr:hypothetical protein J1614_002445 [Plenodomus biglobosus]
MTPRRPSSAHNDTGPQRLPFAAAEALLWGPEMKKQHQWLLQQMRSLNTQHEAYDARIQTTEAIAEAAEAATARIRHMEQQIIAMEAVDKENTFENWAMAEINQLKVFRDDNKNVRQKQIELDKKVAGFADDVDKLKRVPDELVDLIRRVDFVASRQMEDANRMKRLEKEIDDLKGGRQTSTSRQPLLQPLPRRQSSYRRAMTPPRKVLGPHDTSETEDEDTLIPPRRNSQSDIGKVQVPRSPETENALNVSPGSSSTVFPTIRSARQRLFKRPSIHHSKLPKLLEEVQLQDGAIRSSPPIRTAPTAPSTLLVNMNNSQNHKKPIDSAAIHRNRQSQACGQKRVEEQPVLSRHQMKASEQPTPIATRRSANPRKRVIDAGPPPTTNQDTSKQSTQLVATSPRKKPRIIAPAKPNREAGIATSQGDIASANQQNQLLVVLKTPFRDTQIKESDLDDMRKNAIESVKSSPRKAVVKIRSCIPCNQRHTACDKVQPTCGPCVKRSQGHACVYQPSHEALIRSVKPTPASPKKVSQDDELAGPDGLGKRASTAQGVPGISVSPRKRQVKSNVISGPGGRNKGGHAAPKVSVSSIHPTIPNEHSASLRPREAKTRATAAILTTTTRRTRRAIPDTRDLDFDTFLKMKRENPKF